LEVERMFDRYFPAFDRFFPTRFTWDPAVAETEWAPQVDCSETEKEFILRLEAPGVKKEDFDITVEGTLLTVTGHREMVKQEETEESIWKERQEGRFVRSMRLPKAVQAEKVAATYEGGILVVRVPKAEPTIKSKILVK
jgi:HSP20 family protein